MSIKNKILLMRFCALLSGYICLFMSGMSVYIPVGEEYTALIGVASPWIEWMVLAMILFVADMLVLSRFQHLFREI